MAEWTKEIARRLSGLALGPARELEIIEEMALHLEARVEELQRDGASFDSARAQALAEIDEGGLAARLAPLRQAQTPEPLAPGAPRGAILQDLWRDARLALRMLRSRPAFTAVALLTLGLGLGANTAIFSVVHAVLLRPLPFHEPDRLVFVWNTAPERPIDNLTPGRLVDFRARATSFDAMAGLSHVSLNLTGRGTPERLSAASVSANFFEVLGVRPLHGRTFNPRGEADRAVVLSHALWRTTFNSEPLVGQAITLNGMPHMVLGVMPEPFAWPTVAVRPAPGPGPELFVIATSHDVPDMPVEVDEDIRLNRRTGYLRAVARLGTGVSLESAHAEIAAIAATLEREHPVTDAKRGGAVVPMRAHLLGSTSRPLLLILGAVTFVLLIACANVANLLMGRAASRRREFELRLALGAGRRRLMQQLLVESAVLALAGGVLGIVLAWWTLGALVRAVPDGIMRLDQTSLSVPVLAFSMLLAAATAALFGLLPAMQAGRLERSGLRDDGRTVGGRGRARSVLVAAEVAVAVTLMVGASLLVRSFISLQRVDVGLDTEHLLTFDLKLSGERAEYQSQSVAFYERVLERVRAIPGVAAAGMAVTLPIGGDDFGAPVTIDGRPLPPEGQEPAAGLQMVSPGYFAAAGMPLLAGRDVALTDTRDRTRVAVVNRAFADQHWPGDAGVGKRFRIGTDDPVMEVVGLVENIRHLGPATAPRPEFYLPYSQSAFSFMSVIVRAHGDPAALAGPVRQAVAALDPAQPVARVMTMGAHLRNSLAEPRFLSTLTMLFGGLALVLAAIGIYGVMAWSVAVRTREFGVRFALGARPSALLRQVLGEGLLVVAAGAIAGLAMAAALSRLIGSLLFETSPTEPSTYAAAAAIVVVASLAAMTVPALRATRIDPITALRSE
ncbi:MAG: ABC transporter permease [Acidobacteriota bacterium]|nr:ABC transporter permease [Acidobacteriota bacterium]